MNGILASIFVPIVTISMTDGSQLQAAGTTYETFDACMVQAEHDAKIMVNNIENVENTLEYPIIDSVVISCEQRNDIPAHTGYVPLSEYYHGRR